VRHQEGCRTKVGTSFFLALDLRLFRLRKRTRLLGQLPLLTDVIRLHVKDTVYASTRLDLIKGHGDVVYGAAGSGFAVRTASVGVAMNH
jgi:hypothetical protein